MTNKPKESWEMEFNQAFCSMTSIPKYSVWAGSALVYPTEMKQFISYLLQTARKEATDIERDRWLNQSANDHDNKIREAERNRILELPVMKGERLSLSQSEVTLITTIPSESYEFGLKNEKNQLRELLRQQIMEEIK